MVFLQWGITIPWGRAARFTAGELYRDGEAPLLDGWRSVAYFVRLAARTGRSETHYLKGVIP
jgi:hypothetical protein